MRYLSIDIEATGLLPHDQIIQFSFIPFCSENGLEDSLERDYVVKCDSFEALKPNLNPWVIEHNKELIEKSHAVGIEISELKTKLTEYFDSPEVKKYFGDAPIVLFGKSMSSIDIPFLKRDLGHDWMEKYFCHRTLDLSCMVYGLMDLGMLPRGLESGSKLMDYFQMGEVKHTALEDARNTALIYLKILEKFK